MMGLVAGRERACRVDVRHPQASRLSENCSDVSRENPI